MHQEVIDYLIKIKNKYPNYFKNKKYAKLSLINAYDLLKNNGLLIRTAANINRKPHYETIGEDNYYKNISREFLENLLFKGEIEEDADKQDIRFLCKKLM